VSPRIVPVAIGDPAGVFPGRHTFTIVNILSFLLPPAERISPGVTLKGVLVSTTGSQVVERALRLLFSFAICRIQQRE
jgi:hypothetical protein